MALSLEDTTYSHERDCNSSIDVYYEQICSSVSVDNNIDEFETIPTMLDTSKITMSEFVNQASESGKTPTFIHVSSKSFTEINNLMKKEENRNILEMFASFKDLADAVANTDAYFSLSDAGYAMRETSTPLVREKFGLTNEFQKRCWELKDLRNGKAHNFKVKNYFTRSPAGNWEPNILGINQLIIEKKKELEDTSSFMNNELDVKIEDINNIIIGFNNAFGDLGINLINSAKKSR